MLVMSVAHQNDSDLSDIQYAYSAWSPGLAARLELSSTQANLIVRAIDTFR